MPYYYRDDDSGSGCFFALLAFVVIIAILIAIAYFAFIVFACILLCALAIAASVGTVLTLKNYIIALVHCIKSDRRVRAPATWKLPDFTYRWGRIMFGTIREGWLYNVNSIKQNFAKGDSYKFLSIRRWFFWFIGLSVAIFGMIVSVMVVMFHFMLIAGILMLFLMIVTLFFGVNAIAGTFISVYLICRNCIRIARHGAKTLGSNSFARYVAKYGYQNFLRCIALVWKGTSVSLKKAWNGFKQYKILTFEKWTYFFELPFLCIISVILTPIIVVVGFLVQTVLFVIFKITGKGR